MATLSPVLPSNSFMTVAWYWRLKGGIAGEPLTSRHAGAFLCLMAAVALLFLGK